MVGMGLDSNRYKPVNNLFYPRIFVKKSLTYEWMLLVLGVLKRSGILKPRPMGMRSILRFWFIKLSCWGGVRGPEVRSTLQGNL